jgi:hypothetical protein
MAAVSNVQCRAYELLGSGVRSRLGDKSCGFPQSFARATGSKMSDSGEYPHRLCRLLHKVEMLAAMEPETRGKKRKNSRCLVIPMRGNQLDSYRIEILEWEAVLSNRTTDTFAIELHYTWHTENPVRVSVAVGKPLLVCNLAAQIQSLAPQISTPHEHQ